MKGEIDHRSTRRDFMHSELHRRDLNPDPFRQFADWLAAATTAGNFDATGMALATTDAEGRPDVRIVLLKHFDERGLCWYTDQRSPKGQELAANPRAAVVFYWPENDRQVRVDGPVEKLSDTEAEALHKSVGECCPRGRILTAEDKAVHGDMALPRCADTDQEAFLPQAIFQRIRPAPSQ